MKFHLDLDVDETAVMTEVAYHLGDEVPSMEEVVVRVESMGTLLERGLAQVNTVAPSVLAAVVAALIQMGIGPDAKDLDEKIGVALGERAAALLSDSMRRRGLR